MSTGTESGISIVDLLPGSLMHGFRRYSQDNPARPADAPRREILEYPETTAGKLRTQLVCYEQPEPGEAFKVKAELTIDGNDRIVAWAFIRTWLTPDR